MELKITEKLANDDLKNIGLYHLPPPSKMSQ